MLYEISMNTIRNHKHTDQLVQTHVSMSETVFSSSSSSCIISRHVFHLVQEPVKCSILAFYVSEGCLLNSFLWNALWIFMHWLLLLFFFQNNTNGCDKWNSPDVLLPVRPPLTTWIKWYGQNNIHKRRLDTFPDIETSRDLSAKVSRGRYDNHSIKRRKV